MKIEIIEDSSIDGITAKISKVTMDDIRSRKFGSLYAENGDVLHVENQSKMYQILVVDDEYINGKLLVSIDFKKIFYKNTTSLEI